VFDIKLRREDGKGIPVKREPRQESWGVAEGTFRK